MDPSDRLRHVELEDADALESLFDVLGYPASPATIHRRLTRLMADPTYASWVTSEGETVVGFAAGHLLHAMEEDQPVAQLIALVTAPESQGTGAGTALCREFEAWARSNGARRLIVNSGDHREATHDFYLNRGFARTGIRFARLLDEA